MSAIKIAAIQAQAERDIAEIQYITDLVEGEFDRIAEAYAPVFEIPYAINQENLEDKVSATLSNLVHEHLRPVAHRIPLHGDRIPYRPEIKLGWAFYVNLHNGPAHPLNEYARYPHLLSLTDSGIAVVNGMREAMGLVDLDEERRLVHVQHESN